MRRERVGDASFLAFFCSPNSSAQQPDAETIYARSSKSVLLILVRSADSKIIAQGKGFVVEGGEIITNNHVIQNGSILIDVGGVRIPAVVELRDVVNDLAVLSVSAEISVEPHPANKDM